MLLPYLKPLCASFLLMGMLGYSTARAQSGPLTCSAGLSGADVPPTVRAEGESELLGDLVLTCTGGTPTSTGATVPTATFQINLNTSVTNTHYAAGFSDVLLLIDEPHSVTNPNVPLLACGATGSNDNGSGVCPIIGDGVGKATYNGGFGHPNVFQGQISNTNPNIVTWTNVPMESPGVNGTRTLRFTNIRGNISQLAGTSPNLVTATLSAGTIPVIDNPTQTVGIWQTGLLGSSSIPGVLTECGAATTASTPQFSVTIRENFATAFRPNNIAQELANAPVKGVFQTLYPSDENQDIPGVVYNTETGFYDGGGDPPSNTLIPTIPTTADFPAIRSLNQAGVADQGTRVYVSLTSVPAGMTPYVPVTVPLLSAETSNLNQQTGIAVLVSTDAMGNGPFVPVTATAAGLGAMQVNGGTALAVYEILYSNPAGRETITVPITATYAAGALSGFNTNEQIGLQAGLAPFSFNGTSGDVTVSVPRFSATPDFTNTAFLYRPCSQPDMTIGMTSTGSFAPGGTGSFTMTVQNVGDAPGSGSVSVTDSLPAGLTASALTGTGWTCTLATATCTRSDLLSNGSSYPVITLTVNVAATGSGSLTNIATVFGGGESLTANDTATAIVNVTPIQAITVTSGTPGLTFIVDGTTYGSTQVLQWATGSMHSLSVTPEQNLSGSEYIFSGWSDSGAASHTITVGAGSTTYTAIFGTPTVVMQCTATSGVPSSIRGAGETELVNDLVLNCTGGAPTLAGAAVSQVNFTLTFNTNATSHIPVAGFSEALLLIDEPHSNQAGSTNTLLACGAPGSNDDGSGVCTTTGTGTGVGTYNGSAGHPNVFQGQPGAANSIVWRGVPVDAPGNATTRILRFTNLRVNASSIGVSATEIPSQVTATVTVTPGGIGVNAPQQTMATLQNSLTEQTSGVAVLSQCINANPSIVANAANPLDTGGQNGPQFLVGETEVFSDAFKVKNYVQWQDNAGPPFTALYPADVNQDVPGYPYNTETGFFDGASMDANLPGFTPTAEFPSIRGLNTAGEANSGTRVYFLFSSIPEGMQLFVPVSVPLTLAGAPANQTGIAVLTTTDANGAGPFNPVPGNPSGVAPVTVLNGAGMAVYEILYESPYFPESFTVPVAAAYLANQVLAGTVNVQSGLAPLSAVTTADTISPLPRFATVTNSAPAFTIQACAQGIGSSTAATGVTTVFSPNTQKVTLTAKVTTISGPVTGGTVTFTVPGVGGPTAPIPVSNGVATTSLSFAGVPVGSYTIQAVFSGITGEGVGSSSDTSQFLTIGKAQTSIVWPTPGDILAGTPLGALQLDATVSVPGTLAYTPLAGTILPVANNQSLQVTFTPTDSTDYLSSSKTVFINVKPIQPAGPPFGSFDTPAATSNVSGSVGFTGWALAAAGITTVDIWREPNPGETASSNGLVFVGTAAMIPGARPDIQAAYPNYLNNGSAGWGFLLLTNELPSNNGNTGLGNGTYRIHALAHDTLVETTDLGVKTIVVDNADATQPFGTIDTPTQGGVASGTFVNFGWALTPVGKTIPIDGSTIWVFIDGQPVGHPVYNNYRIDIATLFPGYANSMGAVGYYSIDTTTLANGTHTISWTVTDSAGVSNGIGSRYFTVQN